MNGVMTFRELVKKIHPDVNPNITDASAKMTLAVRYKNRPEELYKLAVRWGVHVGINNQSQERTSTRTSTRTTFRGTPLYDWVADFSVDPSVDDFVIIVTKGHVMKRVVRVSGARVYYRNLDGTGPISYVFKKSVYVVRWQNTRKN